ncbi:MAG TPA: VanW family protein [Abditibacteriaceae bacterium]|nr:VanW family protein [Abditibacteriaceae bacterium]
MKPLSPFANSGRVPTRAKAALFRLKAAAHQTRRAVFDVRGGLRRHQPLEETIEYSFLWGESRTPLWNEDRLAEQALQWGKVQNLRCATRRLHRVLVPRGQVFSFWKQVGRATTRRGFAEGRLLREGCVMPAVGGGLCQMSNALYDVALQAGTEIVERHAHSQVVPGSQAQNGRDATVAWNYIDLRFRPPCDMLLQTHLTRDELVVQLFARTPQPSAPNVSPSVAAAPKTRLILDVAAHSCVSCEQTTCFRHRAPAENCRGKIAFLLDECWPEFDNYVRAQGRAADIIVPLRADRFWGKHTGRAWNTSGFERAFEAPQPALLRASQARRYRTQGARRLSSQLKNTARLSRALSKRLSPDVTHVCVAQSLLPFLWRDEILGGRTFDVLMTRLPLGELHRRLDEQSALHPERATLREFRAPQRIADDEKAALGAARLLISPHSEVVALAGNRVLDLGWKTPVRAQQSTHKHRIIAFPGPTAARKGAYEVREACRALGLEVRLLGSELEGDNFWHGLKTQRIARAQRNGWLDGVAAVVQPALVEDQPRLLLEAWSYGVPIIATSACGLGNRRSVQIIPFGDVQALQKAICTALEVS